VRRTGRVVKQTGTAGSSILPSACTTSRRTRSVRRASSRGRVMKQLFGAGTRQNHLVRRCRIRTRVAWVSSASTKDYQAKCSMPRVGCFRTGIGSTTRVSGGICSQIRLDFRGASIPLLMLMGTSVVRRPGRVTSYHPAFPIVLASATA
jgi:hypothetical protein